MRYFVQLVADYGIGDPAFGEVIQKLKFHNPDLEIHTTSVPAFSTLATGFWIAQYALADRPKNFIIYSNTAPRKDTKQKRAANEGEKFAYAKLKNGCEILAVNAEYCFSFVKKNINSFHAVNIPNKGSQFRSRDFYPEAVAGVIAGKSQYIGDRLSLDTVPEIPPSKLVFVDGYGNLKTSITQDSVTFKSGQKVKISMNGVKRMGFYANGNFEVKEGELAFAPGSSGPAGNRFLEIFLRGGSASALFEYPHVGKSVEFEKA